MVRDVWKYVVNANIELELLRDVFAYHLMVDWSSCGAKYALFCGHPSQGPLV